MDTIPTWAVLQGLGLFCLLVATFEAPVRGVNLVALGLFLYLVGAMRPFVLDSATTLAGIVVVVLLLILRVMPWHR